MATWLLYLPLAAASALSWLESGHFATYLLRNSLCLYPFELVCYLVFYTFIYRYYLSPLRKLPHPKDGSVILGNIKRLLLEPWGSPQVEWDEQCPGGLYRVFLGPIDIVIPTSPAALAAVFGKDNVCVKSETVRKGLATVIGNGLVTAEGDAHKHARKMLNPVFRGVRLMVPDFWAKAVRIRNEMSQTVMMAGNGTSALFDVSEISQKSFFNMIMDTVFGLDCEDDPQKESELLTAWADATLQGQKQNVVEMFCEGFLPWFVPPQYTSWALDHTPRNRRSIRGRNIIRDFSRDQIRRVKANLEGKDASMTKGMKPASAGSSNILTWMIESGMTDENELVNHLKTLLAAGHETTAAALDAAFFSLAKDATMQTKIRAEIVAATQDMTGDLTAEIMDSMPYLHGFVMEILRLYPSILITTREPAQDAMIDGTLVPKGTPIFISMWAINRNPRVWGADALDIVPERWPNMTTTAGASGAYSFMSFIHGTRICIGKEYAIRSIKAVLVAILRDFRISESVAGQEFKLKKDFSMRLQDVLNLRFELIN